MPDNAPTRLSSRLTGISGEINYASLASEEDMRTLLRACKLELGRDIQLRDDISELKLLSSWAAGGSLAIGETYMWGWWVPQPDLHHVIRSIFGAPPDLLRAALKPPSVRLRIAFYKTLGRFWAYAVNTRAMRARCGDIHYDMPAEVFDRILGHRRAYSCGIWGRSKNLDCAEDNKISYIANTLGLHEMSSKERARFRVLDIGCGWGSLVNSLVEEYGVDVSGITNARETVTRVDSRVQVYVGDLLELEYGEGLYDAITMIEIEHVGKDNYKYLFQKIKRALKSNGIFFMESILARRTAPAHVNEEFVAKYVFPGGYVPSISLLTRAAEDARMKLLFHHDLGEYHFPQTLKAWVKNTRGLLGEGLIPDEAVRALEMAYTSLWVYCETDRASMAMLVFAPRGGVLGVDIQPPALPPRPVISGTPSTLSPTT